MMNQSESEFKEFQAERLQTPEEENPQEDQAESTRPVTLAEDPDYKRIRDELNQQWLNQTGAEPFSSDHQDYLFGTSADSNAVTLDQDAERVFREQFSERAKGYDEMERIRVYESIADDPAYIDLQKQITIRTNTDSQVRAASRSGRDWGGEWDRANRREQLHGMNYFARTYPEKAQAYADRWNTFVDQHPEVINMNNAEWQSWCNDHPGLFSSMNEYRSIARAVEYTKRRSEVSVIYEEVRDTQAKLLEARSKFGLEILESPKAEETPLTRQEERLKQLQLEDVVSSIRMSIPSELQSADRETLQAMQKELADLPYVPGEDMREVLDYDGEDEGVLMVDTNAIVGSVSPAFRNWSTEYEGRKGRIVDVAQEIMKGTPESVDHVFHVTDPSGAVKLKKISGPEGDLFFVVDGTHRVAGSKLAELPELPAQVENMTELSEVHTTDPQLRSQWEQRIRRGFIRGEVEEVTTPSGQKSYNLKIDSQVLPWMTLPQHKLIKMTKFYFECYPKALDGVKSLNTGELIPKEALLDEVAMNFYLADRWDEY